MKKSTKNLFIVNTVLSFLICVVFFMAGAMLVFNIAGIRQIYIDVLTQIGVVESIAEANTEINFAIFDCLIGVFLNSYAAGVYLKLVKSKAVLIGAGRTIIYVGIMQCLFAVSLLPGVLAIIGGCLLKKEETAVVTRVRTTPSPMEDLTEKIAMLKDKKTKNLITEEEYNTRLSQLLENNAKQISGKVELVKKEETLQEKIAQIKNKDKEEK